MQNHSNRLQEITQPQPGTTDIPAAVPPQMNLMSTGNLNSTAPASASEPIPTQRANVSSSSNVDLIPSTQDAAPSLASNTGNTSSQITRHNTTPSALASASASSSGASSNTTLHLQESTANSGADALTTTFSRKEPSSSKIQVNPDAAVAQRSDSSTASAASTVSAIGSVTASASAPALAQDPSAGANLTVVTASSTPSANPVSNTAASIAPTGTASTAAAVPMGADPIRAANLGQINSLGSSTMPSALEPATSLNYYNNSYAVNPAQISPLSADPTAAMSQLNYASEYSQIPGGMNAYRVNPLVPGANAPQSQTQAASHNQATTQVPSQGNSDAALASVQGPTAQSLRVTASAASSAGSTQGTAPGSSILTAQDGSRMPQYFQPVYGYNVAAATLAANSSPTPLQIQVQTQIAHPPLSQMQGAVPTYGIPGNALAARNDPSSLATRSALGPVPAASALAAALAQNPVSNQSMAQANPSQTPTPAQNQPQAQVQPQQVQMQSPAHQTVFHQSHPAQMLPLHSSHAPIVQDMPVQSSEYGMNYHAISTQILGTMQPGMPQGAVQMQVQPGSMRLTRPSAASQVGQAEIAGQTKSTVQSGANDPSKQYSAYNQGVTPPAATGMANTGANISAVNPGVANPGMVNSNTSGSTETEKTVHMSMFDSGMPKAPVRKTANLTPSQEAMSFLRQQGVVFPEKKKKQPKGSTDSPQSAFDLLLKMLGDKADMETTDFNVSYQDYWIMRQNENRQVQQEVKQSQDTYYREYMQRIQNSGDFNPEYTFEKLRCDQLNMNAFKFAEQFVSDMDQKLDGSLFLILGNPGTGKTALCHAMAQRYIALKSALPHCSMRRSDLPLVLMVNFSEIVNSKMFSFNENPADRAVRERRFDEICNVDLLIVDDVCEEREVLSTFAQKVFAELLSYRCEQHIPIVIATPLGNTEIADNIGVRCFERINSFYVIATCLEGASRRPRAIRLRRWPGLQSPS